MIERYQVKEISDVFSDEARMRLWLDIEVACVQAWSEIGHIPPKDAKFVVDNLPIVDAEFVKEVNAREETTNHDLAAFVDIAQARTGFPAGAWIHYGLTSSDVVDTAFSLMITSALDVVIERTRTLVVVIATQARVYADALMVGRTHGIHAEPTTFGAKLALWALQFERDLGRLRAAKDAISVGKLSGAVGTFSNIDPRVEEIVLQRVGLTPVPATQVIARDRHAQVIYSLASLGSSIEAFATEIRHLQRTEVREVEEAFAKGQKGSSAMPHKRNPILSERLTGMARVLRSYVGPALEDVALWHERDISHSSVERIVFPDAFHLAAYMADRFGKLVKGLVVNRDRMLTNFDSSFGLVYSQPVLLALVNSGLERDEAYRIVQRAAMSSWGQGVSFHEVLRADPAVVLDDEALRDAMDPAHSVRHIGKILSALDGIEERV